MTTVLLVDDERDLLSVLDFNLRAAGFETVLATRGEEALLALKRRTPDLVLLDLMLPDIPGTEVCRRIKSEVRTRHVPVVMLTAKGEEVDRVVGFEVGAEPDPVGVGDADGGEAAEGSGGVGGLVPLATTTASPDARFVHRHRRASARGWRW